MAYIVIADDDEIVANYASEILIGAGHACGWVTDGQQALDLLKWRRPDLLLLDHDMPGMTGGELLRTMRKSAKLYDLPVIMFTAMTGAHDEEQARFQGAQDYIRKPLEPKFLLWRINQVLRAREERPQHRDLVEAVGNKPGGRLQAPEVKRSVL